MISQIDIEDMRSDEISIELTPELADEVTAKSLRRTIYGLRHDMSIGKTWPIFSFDEEEERAKLLQLLASLTEAHNWFALPKDHL